MAKLANKWIVSAAIAAIAVYAGSGALIVLMLAEAPSVSHVVVRQGPIIDSGEYPKATNDQQAAMRDDSIALVSNQDNSDLAQIQHSTYYRMSDTPEAVARKLKSRDPLEDLFTMRTGFLTEQQRRT